MTEQALVYLNVGGIVFVTRRVTLQESSSFFADLIASFPECSEIFVDRDATYFRHVLNWIRGVRYLPEDDAVLKELAWEADYFKMSEMREAIIRMRPRHNLCQTLHKISTQLTEREPRND